MIISCIGDSLTEGDYGVFGKSGIANVKEKNYPYFLAQIMNCEVRNYGKCGANSTSYIEYYRSKKPDITNSDIIIIMLGTNGGLDPEHDSRANTDFDEIVKACNGDEPKAEIILCTPPRATENPEYSNYGYAEQVKKAVLFVRNFADKSGLKLIDVANCPYFTAQSEYIMQPNDGLHFSETGYRKLAEYIALYLKNIDLNGEDICIKSNPFGVGMTGLKKGTCKADRTDEGKRHRRLFHARKGRTENRVYGRGLVRLYRNLYG